MARAAVERRLRMRRSLALLLVGAIGLALASCSSSDSSGPDTTPPTVTAWSIDEGATDVGLITPVAVTFSEDMDASTITDTTIFAEGRAPRGYVEYDESSRTATYLPDTLYAQQVWHALVIDGPTDESGNPLERDSLSFQTGMLDCAHLQDYLEPNGDWSSAADVELDRMYRTLAVCEDDEDYYAFTLSDTRKVTVSNRFVRANSTMWRIHFVRNDGANYTQLTTMSAQTGNETRFSFTFLPGTYLVRLLAPEEPDYVLYDMELETSAPCVDDAYEDNDFLDEAAPLTIGETYDLTACMLDSDVFSFNATAGQTITLSITQAGGGTAYSSLYIQGPSGSAIASHASADNAPTLQGVAETTGEHYVQARFWQDGVEYQLLVEIED
jgi:hypothetical protein